MASDLQEMYNQIKKSGKHSVEGIVQWLLDAGVIDKNTEVKMRSYLSNAVDKTNITAEKFKEAINELASDQKRNVEELSKILADYGETRIASDLEATYNKLRESGRHSVDGILQWLQDAKIIDKAKDTEEKVRSYFANTADNSDITAESFREVINEIADEQKRSIEELSKTLAEYGCAMLNKLKAAAQDVTDSLE